MKISSSDDNPDIIQINPFLTEKPPEPFSFSSAPAEQVYLIGKHVGKRAIDLNTFVSLSKLVAGSFRSYRQAKLFLDKHPEIRSKKPSPQRLEVHAGDWFKCNEQAGKYTPSEEELYAIIEASRKGEAERKAEIDSKRPQ